MTIRPLFRFSLILFIFSISALSFGLQAAIEKIKRISEDLSSWRIVIEYILFSECYDIKSIQLEKKS